MNETLVKYLAGLLDADGCLSFTFRRDKRDKSKYHLGLRCYLGASDTVDISGFIPSLPEQTGLGSVYKHTDKHYVWQTQKANELERLLPRVMKHMVIKAKHWNWMYEIWRANKQRSYGESYITEDEMEQLKAASKTSRSVNAGPLKPKKHPTWAWVSGYLDGDGWYLHRNPSKHRYGMHVGATAHKNDKVGLELLLKAFGGKIKVHNQSDNVLIWERSLSNANRSFALRFLPKVAKHSKLKRHKIEIMIYHHQQRLSASTSKDDATV